MFCTHPCSSGVAKLSLICFFFGGGLDFAYWQSTFTSFSALGTLQFDYFLFLLLCGFHPSVVHSEDYTKQTTLLKATCSWQDTLVTNNSLMMMMWMIMVIVKKKCYLFFYLSGWKFQGGRGLLEGSQNALKGNQKRTDIKCQSRISQNSQYKAKTEN